MGQEKEYIADILFGATSESYDLETELNLTDRKINPEELREKLEKTLPSFVGTISQTVPAYSAVKVSGKRLYKEARAGKIDISTLPVRTVNVKDISIESIEIDEKYHLPLAKIKITTGSGFYVRSFAHDLGEVVGVGAVLTGLVRSRIGEFSISTSKEISSFLISL